MDKRLTNHRVSKQKLINPGGIHSLTSKPLSRGDGLLLCIHYFPQAYGLEHEQAREDDGAVDDDREGESTQVN